MFSPRRLFLSPGGMIVAELSDLLSTLSSGHLCIVLCAFLFFCAILVSKTTQLLRHVFTCLASLVCGWPYKHCWDEDEEDE